MHILAKEAKRELSEFGQMPPGSIIMIGPPGVGRKAIIESMLEQYPALSKVVPYVTQKRRPPELQGQDYWHVSHEEFLAAPLITETVYATDREHRYGIPLSELKRLVTEQRPGLFVTTHKGMESLYNELLPKAHVAYITATHEYRFKHLVEKYQGQANGHNKAQARMSFGNSQVDDIEEDSFLSKKQPFSFQLVRTSTPRDTAYAILYNFSLIKPTVVLL